ncbi:MAG: DUF1778 domain-containing protein [Nitrospina sp.]|jgi:hypothetical protein|nr:DUF1778 domain-containing protein [Nitrospina sp.]MBT6855060.1 DUF1778 domain-containing protein [Nitrospina sp.]
MQNSKEHDEDTDERNEDSEEITLAYFESWRKPCGKTERIYLRVTPETKAKLLTASKEVNLSLSDFVTGATLEAAKFIMNGDN